MKEVLCIECGMSFPSEIAFQAHKQSGHKTKGKLLTSPEIPTEIAPTPEFLEAVNRIEAKKAEVTPNTSGGADPPVILLPPSTDPVRLTYLFRGNCPTHNIPVETYEVDVMKKHIVLAICPKDKQQLLSKEVVKLD